MKKFLSFVLVLIGVFPLVFCSGCSISGDRALSVYRFHIRANSNSSKDQYVKYYIKDKIMELMNPLLENIKTAEDAEQIRFQKNFGQIKFSNR